MEAATKPATAPPALFKKLRRDIDKFCSFPLLLFLRPGETFFSMTPQPII